MRCYLGRMWRLLQVLGEWGRVFPRSPELPASWFPWPRALLDGWVGHRAVKYRKPSPRTGAVRDRSHGVRPRGPWSCCGYSEAKDSVPHRTGCISRAGAHRTFSSPREAVGHRPRGCPSLLFVQGLCVCHVLQEHVGEPRARRGFPRVCLRFARWPWGVGRADRDWMGPALCRPAPRAPSGWVRTKAGSLPGHRLDRIT